MNAAARAALVLAGTVAGIPAAQAQSVDAVLPMLCGDAASQGENQVILQWRIAEAVMLLSGHRFERLSPSGIAYGSDAYGAEVLRQTELALTGSPQIGEAVRASVLSLAVNLGQSLRTVTLKPAKPGTMRALSEPPQQGSNPFWPVRSDGTAVVSCIVAPIASGAEPPPPPWSEPTKVPILGFVGERESLPLTGPERKGAKAATISVQRAIKRKDDGTQTTDTTFAIDAVLGLRLTGGQTNTPAFLYADYSLSRARTTPAPLLAPGKRADDADTNVLYLGVAAPSLLFGKNLELAVGGGYILDFAKDSRRWEADVQLGIVPPTSFHLPFCSWGALKPIGGPTAVRGRCSFALVGRYSDYTQVGRATIGPQSEFIQVGSTFLFELAPPAGAKQGVAAHLRFRWLETVDGTAPDILRVETALKYRWWVSPSAALDIGVTYDRGRELKSFADEDKLTFGFGVLF